MLLKTDSYKLTHHLQNPDGCEVKNSYIEARGGAFGYTVMFGLQVWLERLREPDGVSLDMAEDIAMKHIGVFDADAWLCMRSKHGSELPLVIEALPEGTVVPHGMPMLQVRNTDPAFPWLPAYIETSLLRAVWYPSTVAALSRECKRVILTALEKTSDDPHGQVPFKLHDFGARGCSSGETAALGGLAHLVNFKGTDTLEALVYARRYYGEDMAGFSIPASEHSTVTAWGRDGEVAFVRRMISQFGGAGKLFAVVGDSWDIFNFAENVVGGECKAEIEAMGGTIVVRPDSGDPAMTVLEVIKILMRKFGARTNGKGYAVLPDCVRVIQGDGVNLNSIEDILARLIAANISIDNIAFGMGGALLQGVNRDTCRFAMKTSAAMINGEWVDVYKDPISDKGKVSKRGIQTGLTEVWRDGRFVGPRVTLAEIRARAALT